MQPVRVLDPRNRVGDALHGSRDGDDLLYGAAQALSIVGPVNQFPHIWCIRCIPACMRTSFICSKCKLGRLTKMSLGYTVAINCFQPVWSLASANCLRWM